MKKNKFEQKFGKYAISNLTLILIICYVVGYVIQMINPNIAFFLTLDPYQILKGQVWRLFSWILIPPSSLDIFTIIMLMFYYNLGTVLEKTWGTYRYNVYIFSGMLLTVVASFLYMGTMFLLGLHPEEATAVFFYTSGAFSTYYINLSIFLAFAVTYPDMQVLLMFVIPVKVKWMAILDIVLLLYDMLVGGLSIKFAVGAALVNFVVFYLSTKSLYHMNPKQMKRRAEFKSEVKRNSTVAKHKCAICGRTEEDDPSLEFRFCSKCNGNYEYCQNHLFTHEHVK